MTKLDFTAKNRSAAKSFHDQRSVIKKVFQGKKVLCETCQQILKLIPPQTGQDTDKLGVCCDKGCTSIELEFEL